MPLPLPAAYSAAFARAGFAALLSAPAAALLAAFVRLVNCGPGAPLRFLLAGAALFVALLDVLCLSFLLRRVLLLTSSCHVTASLCQTQLGASLDSFGCGPLRYARPPAGTR